MHERVHSLVKRLLTLPEEEIEAFLKNITEDDDPEFAQMVAEKINEELEKRKTHKHG